jgi:hypothetical protein
MLREMGIQVWIPKESEEKALAAVQEIKAVESENLPQSQPTAVAQPVVAPATTSIPTSTAPSVEDDQSNNSTALEMKWTLLLDQNEAAQENLRSQVLRAIEDLGVTCQVLELGRDSLQASHIEGQVLIALGQKMGQLLSGERDSVDHLRGILFDAQNKEGEEIPALVSYSLTDLARAPKNKSSFWDDLLWARSVWLDSRLY